MTLAITGKVWVFGDDLNTDAMYPAFAMKMDPSEAAKHVFYEVRPGWTDEVSPGDIVVAGKNFGLGSSRPVAALFTELGVAGLVAEEFNSLFFRNAVNAGLPAMTTPAPSTSAPANGATRQPGRRGRWPSCPTSSSTSSPAGACCRGWRRRVICPPNWAMCCDPARWRSAARAAAHDGHGWQAAAQGPRRRASKPFCRCGFRGSL
jgi:3-isopropylmalate/(R)-2-methylmalate dehydratase small subunit